MMDRSIYNRLFGTIAAVFAIACVVIAWNPTWTVGSLTHKQFGAVLIGIWVIAPPIFFWADWVCYSGAFKDEGSRDLAKHTHDLSRNIWLALIVLLAYMFDVPLLGGGH